MNPSLGERSAEVEMTLPCAWANVKLIPWAGHRTICEDGGMSGIGFWFGVDCGCSCHTETAPVTQRDAGDAPTVSHEAGLPSTAGEAGNRVMNAGPAASPPFGVRRKSSARSGSLGERRSK